MIDTTQAIDLYAAVGMRGVRPRSALFSKALLPGSGWNTQDHGSIRLEFSVVGGHMYSPRVVSNVRNPMRQSDVGPF